MVPLKSIIIFCVDLGGGVNDRRPFSLSPPLIINNYNYMYQFASRDFVGGAVFYLEPPVRRLLRGRPGAQFRVCPPRACAPGANLKLG